jgi:hypothetical protein
MGSKGKAPKTPDYVGQAQAQAQGNVEAARIAAAANRVSQYTPYGNLVYSRTPGGGPDDWQSTVSLSDTGQKLLDQSNKTALGLGDLQNSALDRVSNAYSKPYDYSSVGDIQKQAEGAITSRLDPMWTQRQGALENQLLNQGITRGSEAWSNAMRDFDSGRNDAYQQAILAGINTMPQTQAMATALRNQPLNELNAIRGGSQVTDPSFGTTPQQATTQGPDLLGAAQAAYGGNLNAYNAKVGQQNQNISTAALATYLLGPYAGAAALAFSDRRLKSNIRLLGNNGRHNWYEYTIFGRREIGVMAQEVLQIKPNAIFVHPSGYLMVNYGDL